MLINKEVFMKNFESIKNWNNGSDGVANFVSSLSKLEATLVSTVDALNVNDISLNDINANLYCDIVDTVQNVYKNFAAYQLKDLKRFLRSVYDGSVDDYMSVATHIADALTRGAVYTKPSTVNIETAEAIADSVREEVLNSLLQQSENLSNAESVTANITVNQNSEPTPVVVNEVVNAPQEIASVPKGAHQEVIIPATIGGSIAEDGSPIEEPVAPVVPDNTPLLVKYPKLNEVQDAINKAGAYVKFIELQNGLIEAEISRNGVPDIAASFTLDLNGVVLGKTNKILTQFRPMNPSMYETSYALPISNVLVSHIVNHTLTDVELNNNNLYNEAYRAVNSVVDMRSLPDVQGNVLNKIIERLVNGANKGIFREEIAVSPKGQKFYFSKFNNISDFELINDVAKITATKNDLKLDRLTA